MISNLFVFSLAIAKVALLCGFAPAIAFVILAERFRLVRFGLEKVSVGGQLAGKEIDKNRCLSLQTKAAATSPPRKVERYA
jgi:hypothetical protein